MSIQSHNSELAACACKIISIEPTPYAGSSQHLRVDNIERGGDGRAQVLEQGTLIPVGGTSSLIPFC